MDITSMCKMLHCKKGFLLFPSLLSIVKVMYGIKCIIQYTLNYQNKQLPVPILFLNVLIMVAAEIFLKLGCTLCPAFLFIFTRTWSVTVAQIASERQFLVLLLVVLFLVLLLLIHHLFLRCLSHCFHPLLVSTHL